MTGAHPAVIASGPAVVNRSIAANTAFVDLALSRVVALAPLAGAETFSATSFAGDEPELTPPHWPRRTTTTRRLPANIIAMPPRIPALPGRHLVLRALEQAGPR
jgi:hypothetical protein